jgi:creatinine amidohydrolase
MAFRKWQELSSAQVGALDARRAVAVLPLAAIEQHGPHLPTGTDWFIAEGLIAEASSRASDELSVVVLPTQAIGASLEHQRFPGTLSLSGAEMIWVILAQADGVARAGLRKLVLVSAHGGNVSAMTSAALECRARHRMLAVTTTFARLGLPDGLIDEREKHLGAHAGLVETALMLRFRPELVNMANAADFTSLQETLNERFRRLRAYGPVGFGWLASDLNRSGATGNAGGATAEIGAAIAAHHAAAFLELLQEVAEAEVDTILSDETRL